MKIFMHAFFAKLILLLLSAFFIQIVNAQSDTHSSVNKRYAPEPYFPADKELYNTIVYMDSIYFDTYNNCNLEKMKTLISDSIEFYHDRGGLTTSKIDLIESIKKNICGKVTRELVPNSIEVYPIANYGAVEIGYHRFHNNQENVISKPDKFIVIWQKKNSDWLMARVISLH